MYVTRSVLKVVSNVGFFSTLKDVFLRKKMLTPTNAFWFVTQNLSFSKQKISSNFGQNV